MEVIRFIGALLIALTVLLPPARGAEGEIRVLREGTDAVVQVRGDPEDDWRLETSEDLSAWSQLPGFGALLSGGTNAPLRSAGDISGMQRFYRAVKTEGLYDPTLIRTISLTFTQANWQTLLTSGRTTGSNTPAVFSMDNGAVLEGVGARYRGNTSFTMGGQKKSLNLDLDYTFTNATLLRYRTLNLNNAFGDETILREPLYFNVMRTYAVCPRASLVKLFINGGNWGVYSFVQQQNSDLIDEWFPSSDGDRWRAPNMPAGGGGPGGGSTGTSALAYLGTNVAAYRAVYELKTDNSTNAWQRLIHAVDVLNNAPTNVLRDRVEEVLAVDRWLWFLALENVFADDDSYYNKGADYMFYYEPESGRIHPIEHDGNEAFIAGDVQLSPVEGATSTARPVLRRLLSIAELRQRYLAHMRTVLEERFNPITLHTVITQYHALSVADISADPKKGFSMAAYTNDLNALKAFIRQRYTFLTNHAELRPVPPDIAAVYGPTSPPLATATPFVTAEARASGTNGLDSVWLYHRGKPYGRFASVQMFDDGAHGDGLAGDGIYGAAITTYPAGTKVRFYVEARSANAAKAARFAPPGAEEMSYSYRVAITLASNTPVVINEVMVSNTGTLADPQGEYDDWIELHNLTDTEVDLTGRYLSDEPNHPRKWQFPPGTTIPPNGFLLIWADEDTLETTGLHASFKLSGSGEALFLTDTDSNLNAVLDSVAFGPQDTDRAYGRTGGDADVWAVLDPTPGAANP